MHESDNQPDLSEIAPSESPRDRLKRLAGEAAAYQAIVVEESRERFSSLQTDAEARLEDIVVDAADLPVQDESTLGPLWPGRHQ